MLGCAASPSHPAEAQRCPDTEHAPADEGTEGAGESYFALPGLSHGLIQSPVNIITARVENEAHQIELHMGRRGARSIENKGHTIELGFRSGNDFEFDGRHYEPVQLHFHTPSEHQIDGVRYPMEMHMVSMQPPPSEDAPPQYLVLAALFKMGAPNPFIEAFLAQVPEEAGEEVKTDPVYVSMLFGSETVPETLPSYYSYRGSLTTPPYSETVQWVVFSQIFEASPEQIEQIHALEGDNARQVQPLLGRPVAQ
jgi:carbonic anhydrase